MLSTAALPGPLSYLPFLSTSLRPVIGVLIPKSQLLGFFLTLLFRASKQMGILGRYRAPK